MIRYDKISNFYAIGSNFILYFASKTGLEYAESISVKCSEVRFEA